ncbi:MAG: hypothetical protein LLG09_03000 [Negativicutes bacterium]|nr:hypothetical protein [Negativicutes bacterium]
MQVGSSGRIAGDAAPRSKVRAAAARAAAKHCFDWAESELYAYEDLNIPEHLKKIEMVFFYLDLHRGMLPVIEEDSAKESTNFMSVSESFHRVKRLPSVLLQNRFSR